MCVNIFAFHFTRLSQIAAKLYPELSGGEAKSSEEAREVGGFRALVWLGFRRSSLASAGFFAADSEHYSLSKAVTLDSKKQLLQNVCVSADKGYRWSCQTERFTKTHLLIHSRATCVYLRNRSIQILSQSSTLLFRSRLCIFRSSNSLLLTQQNINTFSNKS